MVKLTSTHALGSLPKQKLSGVTRLEPNPKDAKFTPSIEFDSNIYSTGRPDKWRFKAATGIAKIWSERRMYSVFNATHKAVYLGDNASSALLFRGD